LRRKEDKAKPVETLAKCTAPKHSKSTQSSTVNPAIKQHGNPHVSATIISPKDYSSELDLRPSCSSARSAHLTEHINVSSNSAKESIANSTVTILKVEILPGWHSKISSDSKEESIVSTLTSHPTSKSAEEGNVKYLDNMPSCSSKARSTDITKHINISAYSAEESIPYTATKYTMPSAKVIKKVSTASAQYRNPPNSENAKIWSPQAITQSRNVWGSKSKGTESGWHIDPRLRKMNTPTQFVKLGPACRKPPVSVAKDVQKLMMSSPRDKSVKFPSSSSSEIEETKAALEPLPLLKQPLVKPKRGRPSSWDKAQQAAKEAQVAADDQGSKSPPPNKTTKSNDGGKAVSTSLDFKIIDYLFLFLQQANIKVMDLVPTVGGGEAPVEEIPLMDLGQSKPIAAPLVALSVDRCMQSNSNPRPTPPDIQGFYILQNFNNLSIPEEPEASLVNEEIEEQWVWEEELEVGAEEVVEQEQVEEELEVAAEEQVEEEEEEDERDLDEISLFASDEEFDV